MTMITPSYLGETIEYSSLHACRSTLEDPMESMYSSGVMPVAAIASAFAAVALFGLPLREPPPVLMPFAIALLSLFANACHVLTALGAKHAPSDLDRFAGHKLKAAALRTNLETHAGKDYDVPILCIYLTHFHRRAAILAIFLRCTCCGSLLTLCVAAANSLPTLLGIPSVDFPSDAANMARACA